MFYNCKKVNVFLIFLKKILIFRKAELIQDEIRVDDIFIFYILLRELNNNNRNIIIYN